MTFFPSTWTFLQLLLPQKRAHSVAFWCASKGVLSNPRKHLLPWRGSLCPGVSNTKKRGSLRAPEFLIQFWTKAAVRGGEGACFYIALLARAAMENKRNASEQQFFLPALAFSGHMASELASSAPKPRSAGRGWACSESHALLPEGPPQLKRLRPRLVCCQAASPPAVL